jgi:hypothetical protein
VSFELTAKAREILKRFSLYLCSSEHMRRGISVLALLVFVGFLFLCAPLSVQVGFESTSYVAWSIPFILSSTLVLRTASFARFEKVGGLEKGD